MSAEKAVETAIQLGLEGIAFTDHLDLDFPESDDVVDIDFNDYSRFMDLLKQMNKGKLKIYKGIEVGFQPHIAEDSSKIVHSFDFDFVIGSVHIIDKMDPYRMDFFTGKTKTQSDILYLEENLFMVQDFKDYDILGHIGYIRRYNNYDDKTLRYADYPDLVDAILKTVISDGKGIEVNTSGYRSVLGTPMPDFDVVKRYHELGGEIICMGSDAHHPEHIAHSFLKVRDILADIGFEYLVHYEERKPVFDKIF